MEFPHATSDGKKKCHAVDANVRVVVIVPTVFFIIVVFPGIDKHPRHDLELLQMDQVALPIFNEAGQKLVVGQTPEFVTKVSVFFFLARSVDNLVLLQVEEQDAFSEVLPTGDGGLRARFAMLLVVQFG